MILVQRVCDQVRWLGRLTRLARTHHVLQVQLNEPNQPETDILCRKNCLEGVDPGSHEGWPE